MQLCAESVQFALADGSDAREKEAAGASVINFAHVIPRNAAGCWRSEMRTGRLIARRAGGSACVLRGVNACPCCRAARCWSGLARLALCDVQRMPSHGQRVLCSAGPRLCSQGAICYYMTVLVLIYVIATLYTGASAALLVARFRVHRTRRQRSQARTSHALCHACIHSPRLSGYCGAGSVRSPSGSQMVFCPSLRH